MKRFFLLCMVPVISIFATVELTEREETLVNHVKWSIEQAEECHSQITEQIASLEGMSGWKVRHFLNNLCSLPRTVYLEIGTWKGSTLIPALYANQETVIDAIAIDNWGEFGGPKEEFQANVAHFIPDAPLRFYHADSFHFSIREVVKHPVNVYFYDGGHLQEQQELAFTYYNDVLDDVFIAVIDDWNWGHVLSGTFTAFHKLNYTVLYEKMLYTNANGDNYGWWNGIYVAVIRKNPL